MAPTSTFATLLAIAASAVAQTTTLDIPFYGYDSQTIVGSVVAVRSSITTIQLACPTDETGGDECGLGYYQTLTIGPSTYNMYISDADFTMTQDCNTMNDVCMESAGGSEANFPGSSTTAYDQTDVETFPVTVTAGASLLAAGPASTRAVVTTSGGVALITGTSTTESVILVSGTSSTVSHTGSSSASMSTSSGGAVATAVPALVAAGAGLMGLFL